MGNTDPFQPETTALGARTLSPHLSLWPGPVNVGILTDGPRTLLIECGDTDLWGALAAAGRTVVEGILLTHAHRDQWAGIRDGVPLLAPQAERWWIETPERFWQDPGTQWHRYAAHPSYLMPTTSHPVARGLSNGETLSWGPATITALATPGHTEGSLSYLVEVDGRRTLFCGDLLYDSGQIWELHSLQKGQGTLRDYHGFLGARTTLIESLRRVRACRPDALIPAHGRYLSDPAVAMDGVIARVEAVYTRYLQANTVRSYFPDQFPSPPGSLPIRAAVPPPACLRHLGTTWVLISSTGAAFVMDCGDAGVVEALRAWRRAGEITAVEGLWITHYHDDHVDAVPAFQQAFACPLYADAAVAEVITRPAAWRLPCLSPAVARVDRVTCDGERWSWREFTFTAYHFPGQSLHHGGLLVESAGEPRLFFVGDSLALAGLDDYCALNRNFLGAGVGYDRCLALLQRLQPDLLFNPHVEGGFAFSPDDYRFLRANLADREAALAALLPWPHPNFGLDDNWARCFPYTQPGEPNAPVAVEVVITNHAATAQCVAARLVLPDGWEAVAAAGSLIVPPKAEGRLPLRFILPAGLAPGRHVVPVDITLGQRALPVWTELVVVV